MTDDDVRGAAFYGRRKGKALRSGQAAMIAETLPALALPLDEPAPARLATLFPHDPAEIRLEIGFGGASISSIAPAKRPPSASSASSPSSTAWPRRWP